MAHGALSGQAAHALPKDWRDFWDKTTGILAEQLGTLREEVEELAEGLPYFDRMSSLSDLVGSGQLRDFPIHRWYYYKEAFSPQLPALLVEELGVGRTGIVVDPFAGVGTTALALSSNPNVKKVIGVEYSPFASFVGRAKLAAPNLNQKRILDHIRRLQEFPSASNVPVIPELAAFSNPEIFSTANLHALLKARDFVINDTRLAADERSFFLLGIAAVTEDLSSAMKDGRALRILRGRKRRRQGLTPVADPFEGDGAQSAIVNQWLAMAEDLDSGSEIFHESLHVQGDARSLSRVIDPNGQRIIPDASVGLHLYSPPYLNFIDYTEVYKLELWLLQMVSGQKSFRALREGTLRSHPSITFPSRSAPSSSAPVFAVIEHITKFLADQLARPETGPVHGFYFEDMYESLKEQYRTLINGGRIACIVANSVFSRRSVQDGKRIELWRLPVMTDIFLARLAEAAGFEDIQIWGARNLQAKNVSAGFARESIVIARKPL